MSKNNNNLPTSCKVEDNVNLGKIVGMGEFVLVGVPPRGKQSGELPTVIGDGAHIRSHTVIYAGNQIGRNFQTGHSVMVRELNQIGDNVSIGTHTIVEHHVTLGDGVRIHSQAFIPEYTVIESGAWIGPNVVCTNAQYPLSPTAKSTLKGPLIRAGAKIGANVTLLPGVEIGEDALIGAGSVVTGDIPPGKVAVGNPARVIKDISDLSAYEFEETR